MNASAPVVLDGTLRPSLNLSLNDGTYMPEACVEVLRGFDDRLALRHYPTAKNTDLLDVIARVDGVSPEHVFLHSGSGPILRHVMPQLIRTKIKSSPKRIARHLWNKAGYPVITPSLTYSKLPKKAAELGLAVHLLSLDREAGWALDLDELEQRLARQDSLVYIANPNNPTGNVLVTRAQLEPLIRRYPRSTFWIDEAYVQYVDTPHTCFSDLVPEVDNLMVGRSFSFAYGLAGARLGYLLAPPTLVAEMSRQLTDYRLGSLQEHLAIAALEDEEHLSWLWEQCARARAFFLNGLAPFDGIEAWDTQANFVFAAFTDGRTGAWLAERMAARGVMIRSFEPLLDHANSEFFRITLGTDEENAFAMEQLAEVLG